MNMLIDVNMAKVGMKLVQDVYNDKNAIIITSGKIITEKVLFVLQMQCRDKINVEVSEREYERLLQIQRQLLANRQYELSKKTKTYSERVSETHEYEVFEKKYDTAMDGLEDDLERMVKYNKYVHAGDVLEKTEYVLKSVESSGQVFDFIHIMRGKDESSYAHFLNVSLICNAFAKWLNMSSKEINLLTLAGSVHDIGKLRIPLEVLKKTDKLTEEEYSVMKKHTVLGYQILEGLGYDIRISQSALMHHERCDGQGYPLKANINTIPEFAKIMAIADVYEAMTATRCYRQEVCPFIVIGLMESERASKYDPKYSMEFFEKMAYTYLGHTVRLNDGRKGQVAFINKHRLSKPIIKVDGEVIDTSKDPNIIIKEIL